MPAVTIHYNLSKRTVVQSAMKRQQEALPMNCNVVKLLKLIAVRTSPTVNVGFCASQENWECAVGFPNRVAPNQEALQILSPASVINSQREEAVRSGYFHHACELCIYGFIFCKHRKKNIVEAVVKNSVNNSWRQTYIRINLLQHAVALF